MEEDGDLPKTLVKLRKTTSDSPRPASTPPTIVASAVQDEDDEEKIIAELEVKLLTLLGMGIVIVVSDFIRYQRYCLLIPILIDSLDAALNNLE